MDDKIVVFSRPGSGHDWRSSEEDTTICSSGLSEYLAVPRRVLEFDAVFSEKEPRASGHFRLTQPTLGGGVDLDTRGEIAWTADARILLGRMWSEGYRYLNVRY